MLPSKDLFFSWDIWQRRAGKYSWAWREPSGSSAGLAHALLWLLRAGLMLDARIYCPAVHLNWQESFGGWLMSWDQPCVTTHPQCPVLQCPAKGPLQQRLQLAAPWPCLTLRKCFFLRWNVKNSSAQCVCTMCVWCAEVVTGRNHCWSSHTGAVRRASELELLVLECPSREAAAETAEKFTFPPGLLCWHQELQTPCAVEHGQCWFLSSDTDLALPFVSGTN